MGLHIGVDATCWRNQRGYGRHARSLLGAMVGLDRDNRYTFVIDDATCVESIPRVVRSRLVAASKPTVQAAASDGRRSLLDMWRMSRTLASRDFDVLFFPTVYSYVPVLSRAKKLVVIHDVIAETFPSLTTPGKLARTFWKIKVWAGRTQASALATVSEYSRRQLITRLGVAADRIHVIGEASDPAFRPMSSPSPTANLQSSGIDFERPVVVYLGGFSPHKNLGMLVDVFASLVTTGRFPDLQLVMVGDHQKDVFFTHASEIRQRVHAAGIQDKVFFTGFLPDQDVAVLLNLASVLVLPSLMEGFGLPAFEAAACGCPVIATTASPVPELLGAGGKYIDPTSPVSLQGALEAVLSSQELRQEMSKAALAAASRLTWEAAARQLLDVIRTFN